MNKRDKGPEVRGWVDRFMYWLITKNFCVLHNTVEHNYTSTSSALGLQLHVSALYVGHLVVSLVKQRDLVPPHPTPNNLKEHPTHLV